MVEIRSFRWSVGLVLNFEFGPKDPTDSAISIQSASMRGVLRNGGSYVMLCLQWSRF